MPELGSGVEGNPRLEKKALLDSGADSAHRPSSEAERLTSYLSSFSLSVDGINFPVNGQ